MRAVDGDWNIMDLNLASGFRLFCKDLDNNRKCTSLTVCLCGALEGKLYGTEIDSISNRVGTIDISEFKGQPVRPVTDVLSCMLEQIAWPQGSCQIKPGPHSPLDFAPSFEHEGKHATYP